VLSWIDDDTPLPPAQRALGFGSDAPGLLAAGGRLTPERLQEAYSQGIFPWYGPGQPVLWWSPDPRMVLPVAEFRLSHSLKKTLRRFLRTPGCELRFDSAFEAVIHACASAPRDGQDGTWIVLALAQAYTDWHHQGAVHSVETWVDGELVGGLYFVCLGRMVFGESMFARRTDASKLALAALVAACRARGVPLIDCQQNTGHLASLGAREWPRSDFLAHLARHVLKPLKTPQAQTLGATPAPAWTYDPAAWNLLDPGLAPLTYEGT
jgi:leucyl/phenylalanyl-tRNA---protein transferase